MQSGNYGPAGMGGDLGQMFGGIFGNSGEPYQKGYQAYQPWGQQGINVQNPFLQNGMNGMQNYNSWLNTQKDPSQFINNLMSQYKQSPQAAYQIQQGNREGQNVASASGLTGSTPFALQMQQNSANISSQDMNNWLGNVLGINSQYGQGQYNNMQSGQNAANNLSGQYANMGNYAGGAAYGEQAGQNQDLGNILGGGLNFLFG